MAPVTHVTQSEGLGLGAASRHTDFGHRQRDHEQRPSQKALMEVVPGEQCTARASWPVRSEWLLRTAVSLCGEWIKVQTLAVLASGSSCAESMSYPNSPGTSV